MRWIITIVFGATVLNGHLLGQLRQRLVDGLTGAES